MPIRSTPPIPTPTTGAGASGPANAGLAAPSKATLSTIFSVRDIGISPRLIDSAGGKALPTGQPLPVDPALQRAITHADQQDGADADARDRGRGAHGSGKYGARRPKKCQSEKKFFSAAHWLGLLLSFCWSGRDDARPTEPPLPV